MGVSVVIGIVHFTTQFAVEDFRPVCLCRNYTKGEGFYSYCNINRNNVWISASLLVVPTITFFSMGIVAARKFSREGEILGFPQVSAYVRNSS
mmetsp:Transcript_11384/g.14807  ORF Transcript_11384/g.14807 Transcript_11384/m.14807 type:complete len:93 (+) Transcript_11384:419-697(+)